MPWCPKCGSEYQPGITVCADCSSPLVEENSAPPAEKYRIDSQFVALALICVLVPWFWVFGGEAIDKITGILGRSISESTTVLILTALILGGGFFYGLSRRKMLSQRLVLGSFLAAVIFQVLICFIIALLGVIHYPLNLFFCVPFAMVFSGIVLMVIWGGPALRKGRKHGN